MEKKNERINEKIYLIDTLLLYEGETLYGKPYGLGKVFYSNGKVYQEGIFDVKGLIEGKEYYPNGNIRFDGKYRICTGYGPNYPVEGKCFSEDGSLIFEGKLAYRFGGVGYPMIEKPEGFGPVVQKNHPAIQYFMWEDKTRMEAGKKARGTL